MTRKSQIAYRKFSQSLVTSAATKFFGSMYLTQIHKIVVRHNLGRSPQYVVDCEPNAHFYWRFPVLIAWNNAAICVKYILPKFFCLGQRLSNPLCQNVAQR